MMGALVASTVSTRVATPLEARERPRSRYEEAIADRHPVDATGCSRGEPADGRGRTVRHCPGPARRGARGVRIADRHHRDVSPTPTMRDFTSPGVIGALHARAGAARAARWHRTRVQLHCMRMPSRIDLPAQRGVRRGRRRFARAAAVVAEVHRRRCGTSRKPSRSCQRGDRGAGATTLRDVLRNVTGISIQAGEGGVPAGDNLSIRGFMRRHRLLHRWRPRFGRIHARPVQRRAGRGRQGPARRPCRAAARPAAHQHGRRRRRARARNVTVLRAGS